MPITALPVAPNRQDPATFSSRADAWVGALDTFTTEANALQTDVNAKQVTASNAATTATNAIQAINSALNRYTFSTTTTMADPGVGVIRFNNATASSATAIAIDAQSADTGNPNILNLLLSFGDSTNNPKGLIRFTQAGTPANYRAYNVTAVTNNTGWVQFTVTHVAGSGSFSNGVSLVMEFHRAGDAGDVQLSANNTFTGNNVFNGSVSVGATQNAATNLTLSRPVTGGTTSVGVFLDASIQSGVTSACHGYRSGLFTQATAFTIGELYHFSVFPGAFGAGSSVTSQYGFVVSNAMTGATNNYGFFGNIPAGAGRWNFYAAGTAANYFAGETTVASGFTIGRSAVTSPSASDGNVFSGTYTPTLTNVSNLTSSTAFQCQYMRVGDVVTVSGSASITPTSSGVVTRLGLSLPVTPSPSFNSTRLLGGTFASSNASQRAGVIYADTTNNRAEFQVTADVSAGITIFFNFTYRVTA